jgi:hypothetical protein
VKLTGLGVKVIVQGSKTTVQVIKTIVRNLKVTVQHEKTIRSIHKITARVVNCTGYGSELYGQPYEITAHHPKPIPLPLPGTFTAFEGAHRAPTVCAVLL